MSKHRQLSIVVGIAVVLTLVSVTSASADIWPFKGVPPDKASHSYCYTSSVSATSKSYIPGAMNYLNERTAIPGVSFHSSCDTQNSDGDGSPATDVAWFDMWVDGAYGEATCKIRTASDSGVCDQAFVKLNTGTLNAAARPHQQYIKTSCHELGHTVGLNHYSALASPPEPPAGDFSQPHDCMMSGDVDKMPDPTGSWLWQYNDHHVNHINGWWS
ncbi:hypothetical protein [Nonomuraea sp. NPDC046570]|uniref:hypothetical protein n=1 Tax=Nonomuraea sp. NPDC046570 TaxID=3155255 RepID=UPI0033CBE12F